MNATNNDLQTFDIYAIVNKLAGNIRPTGDSSRDDERLINLKQVCRLVDELLVDIIDVSKNSEAREHSVKLAGVTAESFLLEWREYLNEVLK